MEIIFAGPVPDASTLRGVLREQGIAPVVLGVVFVRSEDVGEARRIVDSMENGGAS